MTIVMCIVNICDYVFAGCSLTSVTLPDSLTSLGLEAFDSNVKLGPPTHFLLAQKKGDEGDDED